mgnify:CR=1 FL=1
MFREKNGKLKAKLGGWIAPSNELRRRWRCFCSPGQDALHRWSGAGVAKHAAARAQLFARRRPRSPGSSAEERGQPSGMLPADFQRGKMWCYAASASRAEKLAYVPPEISVPLGFFQWAGTLPLAEKKMLRQVAFRQGPGLAAQAMLEAKGIGC